MTEKKLNKKDAGEPSNTQIILIPIEKIIPNREQHTGIRDKEKFEHLKASIQEHGLLDPITVRPLDDKYELISGYHRVEAFKQLGKKEIKAFLSASTMRNKALSETQ